MLSIQQNFKFLTLQYELSMLIGLDLDLEKMLENFLPKTLKFLNCVGGYIWLYSKNSDKFERRFSFPNDIVSLTPTLLNSIDKITKSGFQDLLETHWHFVDENQTHNYFFAVGYIGYILLQTCHEFSEQLTSALHPIFQRLSVACTACLQFTQTESKYLNIFDNSPIPLWEADIANLKTYLDKLHTKGIDMAKYLSTQEAISKCLQMIKIDTANKTTLEIFKVKSKRDFEKKFTQIFLYDAKETIPSLKSQILAIAEGKKNFLSETSCQPINSEPLDILFKFSAISEYDNSSKTLVSIVDITALKLLQAKLEYSALHDPLTGLANRRLFDEELKIAIKRTKRTKQSMALLYLDIDNLKYINDTFGHDSGDLLLIEITKRLLAVIREDDIVARLGGDEFAIILNGLKNASDASVIASRIIESLQNTIYLFADEIHTTMSIGITICPADSKEVAELNKNADRALYAAKHSGKNTFRYFSQLK